MVTQFSSLRRAFVLPLIAISFSTAACQPPNTAENTPANPATSPVADSGGGGNVSLVGAGATFPAPFYQRCFAEYNQKNPNVRVSYQLVGSGAGVEQFTQGTIESYRINFTAIFLFEIISFN